MESNGLIETAAEIAAETTQAPALTLESVIARAYASEINAGIQTTWPRGALLVIGHEEGVIEDSAEIDISALAEAAAWLDNAIRARYPDSDYCKS